ncbi:diguanylate cyclase [Neokomagataea thailandica NBRC 106555]|nr:diguanylate cyclase [Neokomagataea thailandica NBRC 106555]
MANALVIVFIISAIQFVAKPLIGGYTGTDGIEIHYLTSFYAVCSQASGGILLVAAGLLILLLVQQSLVQMNHTQARIDLLTNLPNRRSVTETFQRLTSGTNPPPLSIALVDLDHFKRINDRLGHESGDAVLCLVAEKLRATGPSASVTARIGGEEFVLLLPGCTGEPARLICESMRLSVAALSVPIPHSTSRMALSVSIGLTTVVKGEEMADALRRADHALYEAKQSGRNRCVAALEG